jgi:hypothetical protein
VGRSGKMAFYGKFGLSESSLDFHLYVEKPPMDEGDRWSGRYFRPFTAVYPPSPAGLVPTETERAKNRFLQNLFRAQALYRAKDQQSFPLVSEEQEVETKKGRITFARTYYNVYQRTEFLKEKNKVRAKSQDVDRC